MTFLAVPAHAAIFHGVDFPDGISSFADAVVDYSPVIKSGEPTAPHRVSSHALGAPDYAGNAPCNNAANCRFASLGDGGSITLGFTDNRLTGSDSSALDLWIFEVGPDVEDTFVEISADGTHWFSVGKVGGGTSGVDIDAFGFGSSSQFAFVRLTDDPDLDDQRGQRVGADIDAIGAISSAPVPEPETYAMIGLGALGVAAAARRRRRASKA